VKKVILKKWATYVIFEKTHKVNNRPTVENSPNHVTLFGTNNARDMVNVMITIFANSLPKMGTLLTNNLAIHFRHKIAVFLCKIANLVLRFLWRKYFLKS
jgi:hypothetical protein